MEGEEGERDGEEGEEATRKAETKSEREIWPSEEGVREERAEETISFTARKEKCQGRGREGGGKRGGETFRHFH